jgi:hypothetical protein
MSLFVFWKKLMISLQQMTYGTSAVELKKNRVFASVVERVLIESQMRFGGVGTLATLSV